MWRRTSESKPPVSSPEAAAPPVATAVERPAPPQTSAAFVSAQSRPTNTLLGRGLSLKGELEAREDVTIDGAFEGQISVTGAGVTIGASGRVSAETEADEIIVEGRLEGALRARQRVTLRRSSNVSGSIETPRLLVEDGAIFSGRVEMLRPGEALSPSRSREATAPRAERAAFPRAAVAASDTAN